MCFDAANGAFQKHQQHRAPAFPLSWVSVQPVTGSLMLVRSASRAPWLFSQPRVPWGHVCCQRGGSYLIQAGLTAREGEGESERERYALHSHVFQEVGDAVDDVVEELGVQSQKEKLPSQQESPLGASLPDLLEMSVCPQAKRALSRRGTDSCSAALCEVSEPRPAPFPSSFPPTTWSDHCETSTLRVLSCSQEGWRG